MLRFSCVCCDLLPVSTFPALSHNLVLTRISKFFQCTHWQVMRVKKRKRGGTCPICHAHYSTASPCHTAPYHTTLHHTMPHCTIPCHTCTIPCHTPHLPPWTHLGALTIQVPKGSCPIWHAHYSNGFSTTAPHPCAQTLH